MNLGWKLAATIRGKAPEDLLDTYSTERHPIGAKVLEWSRAQVAIMRPDPYARALNSIFRDLMETRDGATYFAGRVWGIHTRYDFNGDHPLVGHSVPNFELEDGKTVGELMRDGKAILLDFDGNADLKTLGLGYVDRMKYVGIRAKERLGISGAFIRPDGYIAWASDRAPNPKEVEQTIETWLGKKAKSDPSAISS